MKQEHALRLRTLAIHGAPRSGTSWLGQIFNSSKHVAYRYQPLFSYAFKGRLTPRSTQTDIVEFLRDLLRTDDDFVLQRGQASLAGYELEFPKDALTHLVYKEVRYHEILPNLLSRLPEFRLVALVRDPRAAINSWLQAPREFDRSWDVLEEWRTGEAKNAGRPEDWYGFERWKELSRLFLNLRSAFPSRVRVVQYEALVQDPVQQAKKLFDFTGLTLEAQTRRFLRESIARDDQNPYGVFRSRRATIGRWASSLDPAISKAIEEELTGSELEQFLKDGPTTGACPGACRDL